jgi:hypothetical protein
MSWSMKKSMSGSISVSGIFIYLITCSGSEAYLTTAKAQKRKALRGKRKEDRRKYGLFLVLAFWRSIKMDDG